jgi:hypothetical protein
MPSSSLSLPAPLSDPRRSPTASWLTDNRRAKEIERVSRVKSLSLAGLVSDVSRDFREIGFSLSSTPGKLLSFIRIGKLRHDDDEALEKGSDGEKSEQ